MGEFGKYGTSVFIFSFIFPIMSADKLLANEKFIANPEDELAAIWDEAVKKYKARTNADLSFIGPIEASGSSFDLNEAVNYITSTCAQFEDIKATRRKFDNVLMPLCNTLLSVIGTLGHSVKLVGLRKSVLAEFY
jgi:hypothetical protein